MNGFEFVAYGVGIFACAVAVLAIVPNPFRQKVRDTLSIFIGKGIDNSTTEIERAERRIEVLSAQIKEDERKLSDMRGTLNHEKNNKLAVLKKDLAAAEADYELAKEQKLGDAAEADCIDKIGEAEEQMRAQESLVADLEKTVDATRLAIAKAAGELKKAGTLVKSKAMKAKSTEALKSAADILESTRDMASATSELGKDLDKVDEKYEQAKQRFEDAQGSQTERKLEEARKNKEREEIKKRLEERRNGKTS